MVVGISADLAIRSVINTMDWLLPSLSTADQLFVNTKLAEHFTEAAEAAQEESE